MTKQMPPICNNVIRPYFFINGIVNAAAIAGNKFVKIGIILFNDGNA
jgi:hypothetical protein